MKQKNGKEEIVIDSSVTGMGCGEPNFIACYKKVAVKVGEEAAIELYSGMTPEKSAFILASDTKLDNFSVRWTLPRLIEIADNGYRTRNQVLHCQQHDEPDTGYWYDDYDRDEFFGSTDTVTYARWLYNRFGAGKVAKVFGVSVEFAECLGNSSIPGRTPVASLDGDIGKVKELEEAAELRHEAAYRNAENLRAFRDGGSRKLKVRMNRLLEVPGMFVLKRLIEAEEFNIAAKNCAWKYVDYNYDKKREKLLEAIGKLPESGWKRWWQKDAGGNAAYIFYVELPGGVQVSWHGMDVGDMRDVPEDPDGKWDGRLASTLPKLVDCVLRMCPSITDTKFDRARCLVEIKANMNS